MQVQTDTAESFEPTAVLARLLWQWLVVGALLAMILPSHASLWMGSPWLLGVAAPAVALLTLTWTRSRIRHGRPAALPATPVNAYRQSGRRGPQARRVRFGSHRPPAARAA